MQKCIQLLNMILDNKFSFEVEWGISKIIGRIKRQLGEKKADVFAEKIIEFMGMNDSEEAIMARADMLSKYFIVDDDNSVN